MSRAPPVSKTDIRRNDPDRIYCNRTSIGPMPGRSRSAPPRHQAQSSQLPSSSWTAPCAFASHLFRTRCPHQQRVARINARSPVETTGHADPRHSSSAGPCRGPRRRDPLRTPNGWAASGRRCRALDRNRERPSLKLPVRSPLRVDNRPKNRDQRSMGGVPTSAPGNRARCRDEFGALPRPVVADT